MPDPANTENALQSALEDAVKEVLERMFFLEADSGLPADAEAPASTLAAHLTFEGAPPGSLSVSLPAAAARVISADFLGIAESDLSGRQVEEVVCELANMICGAVLSRVESSSTFRLNAPRIGSGAGVPAPGAVVTLHSSCTAYGAFTAILTTEGTACSSAEKRAS